MISQGSYQFKKKLFVIIILLIGSYPLLAKDYNILNFGAVGDGFTMNTVSIQKAVDQANMDGGGRVVFPKGKYLSGGIFLRSNVELHFKKGSVLLGSTKLSDYVKRARWQALITADSANNIAISGKGTIDGQGAALALHIDSLFYAGKIPDRKYNFIEKRPKPDVRPQIIFFQYSSNISVTGVTIKNSSSWVQSYEICNHVTIDGIRVESVCYWNNDGIDIIDSKNVRVTNCDVNASDDGICLKSFRRGYGTPIFCDSVYIANCKVRSSASAVKLGTSSYGGYKNVKIENIKVYDTYRSAIALECYQTGVLENVLVQNVVAKNTGNAIFIRLGHQTKALYLDKEPGKLRNVVIKNVKVKVPYKQADFKYPMRGPAVPYFHNIFPSSIVGIPGHPVQNIHLENIKIIYPGKADKAYAYMPLYRIGDIPEQIDKYPEFSMFGELPSWGFYVRHAENISMKNVTLKVRKSDFRPSFVFDDVKGIKMENITIKGDSKKESMYFKDSSEIQHLKP